MDTILLIALLLVSLIGAANLLIGVFADLTPSKLSRYKFTGIFCLTFGLGSMIVFSIINLL